MRVNGVSRRVVVAVGIVLLVVVGVAARTPKVPVPLSRLWGGSEVVVVGRVVSGTSRDGSGERFRIEVVERLSGACAESCTVVRSPGACLPLEVTDGEFVVVFADVATSARDATHAPVATRAPDAPQRLDVTDAWSGVLRVGPAELAVLRALPDAIAARERGDLVPLADWCVDALERPALRAAALVEFRARSPEVRRLRLTVTARHADRLLDLLAALAEGRADADADHRAALVRAFGERLDVPTPDGP